MAYTISVENFEGPFDLLLQLVEAEKLEITNISLVEVTEPFLRYLNEKRGQLSAAELADFLLVAAKLVYLKSKAIVPSLTDEALDEGPDLATQLRAYQAFVAASKHLQILAAEGVRSFSRPRHLIKWQEVGFVGPAVTVEDLRGLFSRVVRRLEPMMRLPQAAIERVVTLEEKMSEMVERVKRALKTSFHAMAGETKSRSELIITFLALLELTKQHSIRVQQGDLFQDIEISSL